jgi:cytochrome c553
MAERKLSAPTRIDQQTANLSHYYSRSKKTKETKNKNKFKLVTAVGEVIK